MEKYRMKSDRGPSNSLADKILLVIFIFLIFTAVINFCPFSRFGVETTIWGAIFMKPPISQIPQKFLKNIPKSEKPEIIHQPSEFCEENIELLILVKSGIPNYSKRQKIRETWGKSERNLKTYFLLGKPPKISENYSKIFDEILMEADMENDIIIGNFWDTYRNLTEKSIMALKWSSTFCQNFDSLALVDDDIIFDTFPILAEIENRKKSKKSSNFIDCIHKMQINPEVIRNSGKWEKWKVTKEEYPLSNYPNVCTGVGFLMPKIIVSKLFEISKITENYWIDDVYLTGILREKAGIQISHSAAFSGAIKVPDLGR